MSILDYMENSNFTNVNDIGNLRLINPNNLDESGSSVRLEDLSINVELKTIRKKRTTLIAEGNLSSTVVATNENKNEDNINFLKGSKIGDSISLTSNFTEIGSRFSKTEVDGKIIDLETLGITDINVDFNTANAPLVSMTLVDVRGFLFQQGNKSPYSVFFDMPYPIFQLTLKGFYGQGVTYDLHLTKFNSRFNSDNGTFEIKCEFIGYTYAYLSDLLIGYLKGVPYTNIGRSLIKNKSEFTSFKELNTVALETRKKVSKLKGEDNVVGIAAGNDKIKKLDSLKEEISNLSFNEDVNLFYSNGLYVIIEDSSNTNEVIKSIINNFIDGSVNGLNRTISESNKDASSYTIRNIELNKVYFGGLTKDELDSINLTNLINKKTDITLFVDKYPESSFTILDLSEVLVEIDSIISKLNSDIKNNTDQLVTQLGIALNELSIKPNIGEYFSILCEHADLLYESIKSIANQAESDKNSGKRLDQLGNIISNIGGETEILPFPSYKVKNHETGGVEERWIGKIAPSLPEVIFVEELVRGILKSTREDEDALAELENAESGTSSIDWYPIHVFDTPFFNGNKNQYSVLKDSNQIRDLIRLIIFRLFLVLNHNNKSKGLNKNELKYLVINEANNLFNGLLDNPLKDILVNSPNILDLVFKNTLAVDGEDFNVLFQKDNDYIYSYGITGSSNSDDILLPVNINNKSQLNLEDLVDTSDQNRITLRDNGLIFMGASSPNSPLNKLNGRSINNGTTYGKIIKDIFIEDKFKYNTPNFNGLEVQENLVDIENIINTSNFFNSNLGVNLFVKDSKNKYISSYFYNHDTNSFKFNIFKNNIKNVTKYDIKNKQFKPYKLDFRLLGYTGNPKNGINIERKEILDSNLEKRMINESTRDCIFNNNYYVSDLKFIDTNGNALSVFGSKLYRNQKQDKAKAFLLLGSIPFNINPEKGFFTVKDGFTKVTNLFTEKSGIIYLPKAYCLYLGGLLDRYNGEFINFTDNNGKTLMTKHNLSSNNPGLTNNSGTISQPLPYHKDGISNYNGYNNTINFYDGFISGGDYVDTDFILKSLPEQVKNEFINYFNEWVNSEFNIIKNELEIFKSNNEPAIEDLFVRLYNTNPEGKYTFSSVDESLLSDKFYDNYINFGPFFYRDEFSNNIDNSITDFNLELRPDSLGSKYLTTLLRTNIYYVNGTTEIWYNDGSLTAFSDNSYIRANKTVFENYLKTLHSELKKLDSENKKIEKESKDEATLSTFQTLNGEDIRLKVYKDIKSIYDKWICGSNNSPRELFKEFRFINRSYKDISNTFRINIPAMIQDLMVNYNAPLYSHISRVLADNNFNFFPLPNYVDLADDTSVRSVFTPYRWNNINNQTSKPQFICMYTGELSNQLRYDSNFKDDGGFVKFDGQTNIEDFSNADYKIPIFMVRYGDQNQSIFKSINLDQSEFTASNEALNIIDGLSKGESLGQNLFDIFQNRSYSVEIEMMGNLMIQPLMYFMLENVPMFYGLYTIIKVSHTVTNGSIMTKIKGYRIKNTMTKMVDDETLFNAFFNDLQDVLINDKSLGKLSKFSKETNIQYGKFVTHKLVPGKGLISQKPNDEVYGMKKVIDFITDLGVLWNDFSTTHNNGNVTEFYNENIYYNDLSKKGGGDLDDHSSHEIGTSLDIRQIDYKKSKNSPDTVRILNLKDYSVNGTKELLKLAINLGNSKKYKMKNGNNFIKVIYFNDPVIINLFNGIVVKEPGHDNHIHFEFNVPDEVLEKVASGDLDEISSNEQISSEKIYNELKKQLNLSDANIAGIMGNLYAESRFIPTVTNPTGGDYGLAQWKSRKDKLFNYMSKYKKDKTSYIDQISFINSELNNEFKFTKKKMINTSSVEDSAEIFYATYELTSLGTFNFSDENLTKLIDEGKVITKGEYKFNSGFASSIKSTLPKRKKFALEFYNMIQTKNFTFPKY